MSCSPFFRHRGELPNRDKQNFNTVIKEPTLLAIPELTNYQINK